MFGVLRGLNPVAQSLTAIAGKATMMQPASTLGTLSLRAENPSSPMATRRLRRIRRHSRREFLSPAMKTNWF